MRHSLLAASLLLVLAIVCIGPVLNGHIAASASRPRRTKVVTLERTRCFGACPVYKLTIFSDGRVDYEGIKYVRKIGKATGHISRARLNDLVGEFTNVDYFNLPASYTPGTKQCPQVVTDMPSAITSLTWRRRSHSVNHYHGCGGPSALESLTELEKKIDEVVNVTKWTK